MREKLTPDLPGDELPAEVQSSNEKPWSVASGEYRDPGPNVVRYINEKFTDPAENIQATLMKAFEFAGLVKSIKQIKTMTKPLEHSGLLPANGHNGEPPAYTNNVESSDFVDKRDEQLLLELQEGNDTRNEVLLKVIETTNRRITFDKQQIAELRTFFLNFRRTIGEAPPVLKIVAVMLGVAQPENPDNKIQSQPPEATLEMATDVYWMMLRDEVGQSSQSSKVVA